MTAFIPGIRLCESFYLEAVRPILERHAPRLVYSAALIGYGSDVLGFDTPVSSDHLWGPRLYLFLSPADLPAFQAELFEALRQELPVRFHGYSTHFSVPDPQDGGVRIRQDVEHGPVDPLIFFTTVEAHIQDQIGTNPFQDPEPADWLTFQEQKLLEITAGKVYHDGLELAQPGRGLESVRRRFAYYPQDVWLYLLAAQWSLISQEEAFVGRTWQVGDELGSRVVTARQVERLMRLCFLMEKRYAPYSKWFGTAFQHLACAPRMAPALENALSASAYPEREAAMAGAYHLAAEMHNALGITPPLDPRTRTYSGWHLLRAGVQEIALDDPRNTRPHQVIFGGRFLDAIQNAIQDPSVRSLLPSAGSVSQFMVESSDAGQNVAFCRQLKNLLA